MAASLVNEAALFVLLLRTSPPERLGGFLVGSEIDWIALYRFAR
jgi:hypothetical protein